MRGLLVLAAVLALGVTSAAKAQDREQTTTDGRAPVICPLGALTTGLLCEGSFCDDITMRCGRNVREVSDTFWTQWVHRKGSPGVAGCASRFGPRKGFMSGIGCEGDYCDNVALQCSELTLFEPDFDDCVTSAWFSEEEKHGGWQTWPSPFHFVVSLECHYKDHCDLKRVKTCRLKRREG